MTDSLFVVARTTSGRPALQHRTNDHSTTLCGLDMTKWSRAFMGYAIKEILCKKCSRF